MKRMILAGMFASWMIAAMPLSAAEVDWVHMADNFSSTPYNWSAPGYWSGGALPVAGDEVGFSLVHVSGNESVNYPTTVIYDVTAPINFKSVRVTDPDITLLLGTGYTLSASTVFVANTGSLVLSGGTLMTANVQRISSGGYFLQTGGTNTINGILDIFGATYEVRGGALGAASESIGYSTSPGVFLQTGGTNTVGNDLTVGNGTFTQDGGYTYTNSLFIGGWDLGTYSLRSGSLEANNETIGYWGTGIFSQTGGTNDVSGTLTIGQGAYGTYDLSGGTLASSNLLINNGIFNQSGGTSTLGNARIGWSQDGFIGRYDLSGGVLSADSVSIGTYGTGIFGHTGGTSQINSLTLGRTALGGFEGSGTYRLEGTGLLGSPARLTAGIEYIGSSGTGAFDHYGSLDSVHTAGLLYIGYDTGGNGTYTMYGNVLLEAGDEVVGRAGNGSFTQYMGTNRIGAVTLKPGEAPVGSGTLTIGELLGGAGEYSMNPTVGIPELWASTEVIGNYGTGIFTQYGGTNTVGTPGSGNPENGNLYLGRFVGGSGDYTLSGSGSNINGVISPSTKLTAINEYIGDGGTGIFTHSGGNNTLSGDLYLGRSAGGSGTYTLSGSGAYYGSFGVHGYTDPTELKAVNEYIGLGGTGTFDHDSGNNMLSGDLHVGGSGAGASAYNLGGGALFAANIWIGAGAGTGTFTHTAGSNHVANVLTVGAQGTYNLSGTDGPAYASLQAGGIINNGTFNYSAGDLLIQGYGNTYDYTYTAPYFTNNGTLNISGTGERRFSSPVTNNGTVKTTGTTVTFTGDFINNGEYNSDPSTNIFSNLTVGETGYLVGALGDVFRMNGNLIVASLMNSEWNTSGALLEFSSGIHTLDVSGSTFDIHFGILQIDAGGYFSDGSDGTVFADVLNIYGLSAFLDNFNGSNLHINYGSLFAFNADGSPYDVTGEQLIRFASLGFLQAPGTQAPVPEPSTMLLLGSGLVGLVGYGRRRFKK